MKGFVITMYKVAIIGDKDSILAFKSIGIEVFEVNGRDDARRMVDKLAHDGYGVIYITEQIASEIEETIDRYIKSLTPTIVLIPSSQGSLGIGMKKISDNVQKAIGMNIL